MYTFSLFYLEFHSVKRLHFSLRAEGVTSSRASDLGIISVPFRNHWYLPYLWYIFDYVLGSLVTLESTYFYPPLFSFLSSFFFFTPKIFPSF